MLVSHARFQAQVSEKAAINLIAEFNRKACRQDYGWLLLSIKKPAPDLIKGSGQAFKID